jgi:hypothetical protein
MQCIEEAVHYMTHKELTRRPQQTGFNMHTVNMQTTAQRIRFDTQTTDSPDLTRFILNCQLTTRGILTVNAWADIQDRY